MFYDFMQIFKHVLQAWKLTQALKLIYIFERFNKKITCNNLTSKIVKPVYLEN